MTREEMMFSMPAYALGQLPARDAFEISRALIGDTELMEELRFALKVRDMLRAAEAEAPPMPAVRSHSPAPAAASRRNALGRSADKVGSAFAVTGSAVRLAMGFL